MSCVDELVLKKFKRLEFFLSIAHTKRIDRRISYIKPELDSLATRFLKAECFQHGD
jgi:hypothetical protein